MRRRTKTAPTVKREYEIDIDRGDGVISVVVEVETTADYDPCYGADADGRRGVPRMDYEHEITGVLRATDDDGEPLDVATLTADERARAKARALVLAEDEPWPNEPEGPDPDDLYDQRVDRDADDRGDW